MKILLTIHHPLSSHAGAPGATWQLGQAYEKLGHQVQYYSFDQLPLKLPELVESIIFPEFVAQHISKLVNQGNVDVVDASTGDAWVWAKLLHKAEPHHPCLVTRSHGLEHVAHEERLEEARRGGARLSWKYPLYHGGFRLWEVATSMQHADAVLLLNQHDRDYAIHHFGIQPENAHIVHNGIPDTFLNLPFAPLQEDDTIRIAQIGSYIPRKGIHYGNPALNAILKTYDQVQVSFLGTGCPIEQVLRDFDPQVRDRVRVAPRFNHETLPNLLSNHHIKLFPTLSEGFSLALVEAMSCGLAPITTATPGPLEVACDRHNAIVVPPRDTQALLQALESLINNDFYLEKLRRNAYATAQTYSWERIARDNLAIYEAVLCQSQGSKSKLNLSENRISI
ncbi:MAG: glycosyltransferase family 4 protein [Leptolyngbyaceae cyanobacterium RU_5_1]|nr:glycosyltransferase family 4 protein [Leptolyngbyaceae cyanobacterium RU_5_1]